LGLAIVDGLARALKHDLSLSSAPQRGSVFRLALPIARAALASDDLETMQTHARKFDMRVLVIDDDEAVRAGMAQLLRDWGCACVAVESIAEAQAAARAYRPDMVISDYRLREQRTGAEAIAALRAEFGADLPALLITGDTAPERLREARASGVPLLHKPVSPPLLYRRLESMLPDTEGD
jgi:CheY-like chemotaxis protein